MITFTEKAGRVSSTIGKRVLATLTNTPVVYVVATSDAETSDALEGYFHEQNAEAPILTSDVSDAAKTISAIRNAARAKSATVITSSFADDGDNVVGYRVTRGAAA